MGGGDLNLKKSWHPSTLRNIERVWKAEQKHEVEQQKIEQLQKELAAERARDEMRSFAEDQGVVKKRDERLDWMYQGPSAMVNRDDYLLGRKIDKTFEILQSQEKGDLAQKEEGNEPTSLFHPSSSASDVTVDLATKIREDPLFAIMKKEKDQRKNLLMNPVKMKQLQAMLKDTLKKDKKKSKKSKNKKSKKKKHQRDSSSSSSSDSEEEIIHYRKKSYHSEKEQHRDRNHKSSRNYEENMYHRRDKQNFEDYGNRRNEVEHERKRKSHSNNDEDENRRNKHYKSTHRDTEKVYTPVRNQSYNSHQSYHNIKPEKKISSEEKERLRQEMMDNAKWRENQREKNVKRYVKEGEREDQIGEGSASSFIQPMLSKAAEKGTVEKRVKQKIFTIQRNKSDMDRNFARR